MPQVTGVDPRPSVSTGPDGVMVEGSRCASCGYRATGSLLRCPVCRGEVAPARFGTRGRVWASTLVHVDVPGRRAPYGLAYVDLDDGPRVLAHYPGSEVIPVGTEVELSPLVEGDLQVVPA